VTSELFKGVQVALLPADQMSALSLVQGTRRGGGKATPEQRRQNDVTILDVYENAASVKILASDWIDYLHIAKFIGAGSFVNYFGN